MPFLKLDCGILDSSLWPDKPARDIFLTALLMAAPKDFEVAVPQIKADCLEPTGGPAPAGWYGVVAAAGPGSVRRAMVDDVEGIKALVRLGEPDLDSRSDAYQGRRMIRVDGGYLILNFIAYRERDYTVAERQRRWREKQKATVTPLRNVTERYITEAEAEYRVHTHTAPDVHIPTWEEVRELASIRGFLEASAKGFFDHHQDNNLWINQHGKLINWPGKLKNWSEKDRAKGTTHGNNNTHKDIGTRGGDRNAGTYNEGTAHLYAHAASNDPKNPKNLPAVPNAGRPAA